MNVKNTGFVVQSELGQYFAGYVAGEEQAVKWCDELAEAEVFIFPATADHFKKVLNGSFDLALNIRAVTLGPVVDV